MPWIVMQYRDRGEMRMSKQDDFFHEVEVAIAEHRKMNLPDEIHEMEIDGKEHRHFRSALNELNMLSKEELERRWKEIQKKSSKKR
jgi:hypothetical protein